jgi:hypothetical protein
MSSFDPTDFQDAASLVAYRQRSNQIDATDRQMQEVAALKAALQSQQAKAENEESRRNNLYSLKVCTEEINGAISLGQYEKAYHLIKKGKERSTRLGLRQEHFSSLEYKDLAESLSKYFSEILPYFISITPREILNGIRAREIAEEAMAKKLSEDVRIQNQIAHESSLAKRKLAEDKERRLMQIVWGVFFLGIAFLAIIFLIYK